MATLEQYLDFHPMSGWNRQSWDQRDARIDAAFHSEPDIFFTPLANPDDERVLAEAGRALEAAVLAHRRNRGAVVL